MLPLLRQVERGPTHIREISAALADEFGLSAEERAALLPSGKGVTVFRSRASWAKAYLKAAGLVEQPGRGLAAITDRGRALLREQPATIDSCLLATRFPEFAEWKGRSRTAVTEKRQTAEVPADSILQAAETPEERIFQAEMEINAALRDALLLRLKAGDPAAFERVVIDLLKALGYGAGSGGTAQATGGSGDGGIDGVIDEDRLGLDRIYVQAKRFAEASIGAPVIHGFIGALHMRGASKGVLLTTSGFSKPAIEAAQKNPTMRVVLIDGERLAELMIRHGVGVRTDHVVEIRKIDLDYFEPDDV